MEQQHNTKRASNLITKLLVILSLLFTSSSLYSNSPSPKKVIAITQIVAHPSLDEAKRGIIDVLKENGYIVGENLSILEANAQNNMATASLIAKKWASQKPDAIVPISTPSAQTVLKATKNTTIPVVFASVTDPVGAGLVSSLDGEQYISGAMDYPPLKQEIELIKKLVPQIKSLAVLYNPSEANSVKTLHALQKTLDNSIKIVAVGVNNTNEIKAVMYKLVGKVEALYIPSDNTVFSAMNTIVKLSRDYKLPVFTSDPDSVKLGALACIGYTQYAVGRAAGEQLVAVLNGKNYLPIVTPTDANLYINQTTANYLAIQIPANLIGMQANIVK